MLVGKSQGFDLEKIWLTQQTIDVDAKRMSSQFAVQTSTQAPKRMGIIFLNAKSPGQLAVDRLNQLSDRIVKMPKRPRNLLLLIRARQGAQANAVFLSQLSRLSCADVTFVSQHVQISMLTEHLKACFQVCAVGWGQLKVQNQAAQADE